MFKKLVVPVDGSRASFEAVPIAARLAASTSASLDVVMVVDRLADVALARDEIDRGLTTLGPLPLEPHTEVLAGHSVAAALGKYLDTHSGAMIAMSSHGHGRTAAVLGSTADDLLRETFGPIIVIGPSAREAAGTLGGDYVVPLDGSERAEAIVPIAEAWSIEFGGKPWLVAVLDGGVVAPDVMESSYLARRAGDARQLTGRDVEFEVLHGQHPARSICDFAGDRNASVIFLSTHGRTGIDRVRLGSVASEIVRHAVCPVVLYRPPTLLE